MIFKQLKQQLSSLRILLEELEDEHFTRSIAHLGDASIGGHSRHILELIECTLKGYSSGTVDYINRSRNLLLESDRLLAISLLIDLKSRICLPDKNLTLLVEDLEEARGSTVDTTYFREMVYNTEHCIHHLALIKVALIEMEKKDVQADFGMAYSTLKYRSSFTQA